MDDRSYSVAPVVDFSTDVQPRIISRAEHPISRKDIDPDALKVLYRLRHCGFLAYLVGGSVRDLFLGRKPKDFDIATDANPPEIKELFRNSRIIGHRFRLVQILFRGGKTIEVSTFRRRSELDGIEETLPSNNDYGSAAEDAWRRDLTINALFYDIADFSVVDYVRGVEDLGKGIIRVIGDPDLRFIRDPVRMMRAIRHAARAGFTIEEKTCAAIQRNKDRIWLCPISRLRDEWLKDLSSGNAGACVDVMIQTGFFSSFFPFYEPVVRESDQSTLLVKLLNAMDKSHSEGIPCDEAFRYAVFLLPWFQHSGLFWSPQRPGPWFTEGIRESVHSVLGILDVKKSVRENAAHLLAAQPILSEMVATGKLPVRLRPRRYAVEAIKLFILAASVQENPLSASSTRILYKGIRRQRRKKVAPKGTKTKTQAEIAL